MNICRWCGEEYPDQSDKEMFDAQLISTLKDRVKELEELLIEARRRFYDYQMEVDGSPPTEHVKFMRDMEALLPKESTDERKP